LTIEMQHSKVLKIEYKKFKVYTKLLIKVKNKIGTKQKQCIKVCLLKNIFET